MGSCRRVFVLFGLHSGFVTAQLTAVEPVVDGEVVHGRPAVTVQV